MSKYFPKLTQTHVFVQTAPDGSGFNCPMLPVIELGELNACSEQLQNVKTIADLQTVRVRLITLIKKVMPEEYCAYIERFELVKLAELASYLMYGDDDDQPKPETVEPEKN